MDRISTTLLALLLGTLTASAVTDTVRLDDGTSTQSNPIRRAWEESVILTPQAPCRVLEAHIYYASGGTDTVRITGDAAEGTIPPTQYCFDYNTLGYVVLDVPGPGWQTIDLRDHNILLGGYNRVVVQHLLFDDHAVWGQDAGQSSVTSFVYDPITPNPNFFNIPGIFYRASGDYLVRLVVEYETTVQPPATWTDVTDEMGILDGEGARFRSDLASAADINGDGWDDLVIRNVAYINNQGQNFTRKPLGIQAANTVWADIDNDGDVDCFAVFANGAEGRLDGLYENDGEGNLTDRSDGSGLDEESPTVTPLFLDYDHDGDLDLFIANGRRTVNNQEVYYQDRLYRNNGDWTFTNVTPESGIAAAEPAPYYDTWGASIADVNNDGWVDIFVATYRLAPDRLYVNNGDGTFRESSQATGAIGIPTHAAGYYGHGMGSDWADINNDGRLDLGVGNLGHPDQRGQFSNPSLIFVNTGSPTDPKYTNWHAMSDEGILDFHGVTFREMNAGMCFADFNNDGLQDLYHGQISYDQYGAGATRPAHFYLQGADRFEDRTWQTGLFIHGSWTGVRIDYDRDGDMDLLAASGRHEVRLFRNDLHNVGNSVTIRLENTISDKMPRDGSGARVSLLLGTTTLSRQLPGTVIGGRCSQMSNDLHFGLGPGTGYDDVTVTWPDGTTTRHENVDPNQVNILSPDGNTRYLGQGTPRQIYPEQHAVEIPVRPTLRIAGGNGPAEYQISTTADFSDNVTTLTMQSSEAPLQEDLEDGQLYFWRVRFERGPTVGPWSSTWQFTIGAPRPTVPVILDPVMDSRDNPLSKEIVWQASAMLDERQADITYEIEVIDETDGAPLCSATDLTDTTFTVRASASTRHLRGARSRLRQRCCRFVVRIRGVHDLRGSPGHHLDQPDGWRNKCPHPTTPRMGRARLGR